MQSMIASIKRLLNKRFKVSCHYLINRKGTVFKIIDDNKVAWHAGKSKWKSFTDLNKNSIGIELVNKGHEFGYQNFTEKQIKSLIKLCIDLKRKYKIKNHNILGHSDIAPLRKLDPGNRFPWKLLNKKKIGIWHWVKNNRLNLQKIQKKKVRNLFFNNLYRIGYRYFSVSKPKKTDKLLIKSFQRHFRPSKVNGLIDEECLAISTKLAKILR